MADETTLIEQIFGRSAFQGNLHIWGKLFIDKLGRTVGGWLVDSWSEGGAPYWQPHMNWLAKKENKIYRVQVNIGMHGSNMNMHGEDTDIEPERAKFIRANISKWEQEWLDEEARKL